MTTLRDRLRQAMEPKGAPKITRSEIAKACDISPAAVTKWFNGDKPPQELMGSVLVKVARRCNVDPEWLALGVGKPQRGRANDISARDRALLQAFNSLPPEMQVPIRSIIETLYQARRGDYWQFEKQLESMSAAARRIKERT